MWIAFCNWFLKITGWLPQRLVFRTKILYEDKSVQTARVHGPAILICNHTSVYDFAACLYTFFGRTVRFQMAEVLFRKKGLGTFLRCLGGIYVNRDTMDFSFLAESADILEHGGVVGIFPESRIPNDGEPRPLPFKTSAAYLALQTGVPVIPVYTDGNYFNCKRGHLIIGTPILPSEAKGQTEQERIQSLTELFRNRVIELGNKLYEPKGN